MFYMAVMMAAPMGILMLLMMGEMYADKRLNTIIYAGCALLFILAFAACGPRGWSETDSSSAR